MPQFDWIQSSQFETVIRERIEARLQARGVSGYPYTFTGTLTALARENRAILEARQYPSPRSQEDALRSVDLLVETAADIAQQAGRKDIDEATFGAALRARFCQVWPFCK